jgi:hypothetical protein
MIYSRVVSDLTLDILRRLSFHPNVFYVVYSSNQQVYKFALATTCSVLRHDVLFFMSKRTHANVGTRRSFEARTLAARHESKVEVLFYELHIFDESVEKLFAFQHST